jgi:tRNA threonylcarbamoyladenosine biosynthesis protein TsaE
MSGQVGREEDSKAQASVFAATSEETVEFGRRLGELVATGDCVALCGPLGAGKTCFVCGLASGMQVKGRVASPSFIVMRRHPGPVCLYHADAYRLADPRELEEAGLNEWLEEGVVALEWADLVAETLPPDTLFVRIEYEGEGRRIVFYTGGPRHARTIEAVTQCGRSE